MVEARERRRVARLMVPSHLGGVEMEPQLVRFLDLSAEGSASSTLGTCTRGSYAS